jgi:aryl-alcohol dehydrogenase-like predicted oxidoreductase
MERRPLGSSGIEVSALSLGSWRTFERIPSADGLAVMREARRQGIDFLDDARYDDETGSAPIASGWSEVVFGELFRAAGWVRDEVVVANKLWWQFWPQQSAMQELDGSLVRTGLDRIDLQYALPPPAGLTVEALVHEVAGLIESGKVRAWGVANWAPADVAEAARVAAAAGLPAPCAAQLRYSLVDHGDVDDPAMRAALAAAGASVVASASLAGGALSGKYDRPDAEGRLAGAADDPAHAAARTTARRLGELAGRLGSAPATLAFAFALDSPLVASVLFGATRPEQVAENVAAEALLGRLSEDERAELQALAT